MAISRIRTRAAPIAVILVLCAAVGSVLAADFSTGVAAYKRHDFAKAREIFTELAAAGDARAQFALGLMHDNGEGAEADRAEAVRWYTLSAEQGYGKAQYNLALIYSTPIDGTLADEDSARDWFIRAAESGNADGVAWLRRHAESGDVEGQFRLGRMYLRGHGVPRNAAEGLAWLRKAAAGGHAHAAFALGVSHESGTGVAQSYTKAAEHYATAADAGIPQAVYNLARLYRLGRGVTRDLARARELYEQAAAAELPAAQLSLAMLFEAGQGWTHDPVLALHWYRRAATNGSAEAQINLAYLYAEGIGIERDLVESYAWYSLAATTGHPVAVDNLAVLENAMSRKQIDAARARVPRLTQRRDPVHAGDAPPKLSAN